MAPFLLSLLSLVGTEPPGNIYDTIPRRHSQLRVYTGSDSPGTVGVARGLKWRLAYFSPYASVVPAREGRARGTLVPPCLVACRSTHDEALDARRGVGVTWAWQRSQQCLQFTQFMNSLHGSWVSITVSSEATSSQC